MLEVVRERDVSHTKVVTIHDCKISHRVITEQRVGRETELSKFRVLIVRSPGCAKKVRETVRVDCLTNAKILSEALDLETQ